MIDLPQIWYCVCICTFKTWLFIYQLFAITGDRFLIIKELWLLTYFRTDIAIKIGIRLIILLLWGIKKSAALWNIYIYIGSSLSCLMIRRVLDCMCASIVSHDRGFIRDMWVASVILRPKFFIPLSSITLRSVLSINTNSVIVASWILQMTLFPWLRYLSIMLSNSIILLLSWVSLLSLFSRSISRNWFASFLNITWYYILKK